MTGIFVVVPDFAVIAVGQSVSCYPMFPLGVASAVCNDS